MVKLDEDSCRKSKYVTIPYSNNSQSIEDGWLVSSSTDFPQKKANLLSPWGKRNTRRAERGIGEARKG